MSTAARIRSIAATLTGLPGDRAVEIDDVDPLGAGVRPSAWPASTGSASNTVSREKSPSIRRTQLPSRMSIGGINDHRATSPTSSRGAADGHDIDETADQRQPVGSALFGVELHSPNVVADDNACERLAVFDDRDDVVGSAGSATNEWTK